MQTLTIDGTSYKVKFDRDPVELAKLARKAWKPAKFKDLRKFPVYIGQTTAEYIRQFEHRNFLMHVQYDNASDIGTAQYDPSIPLLEDLSDENAN
jgi:hypothetical protein